VVARREHPRGRRGAVLDEPEIGGPHRRVEAVEPGRRRRGPGAPDGLAVARGVGVADVPGEQVERRPRRGDPVDHGRRGRHGPAGVVGLVVAVGEPGQPARRHHVHALVGERGEAPRAGRGPWRGPEGRGRGRGAVGQAEAVVVALARRQPARERVHEVLVGGADRPVGLRDLGDEVADLDGDPGAELAVLAEVDDRRPGRRGGGQLAGHRHRARRVGAEGEVAPDHRDRCLRAPRTGGEGPGRRDEAEGGDDPGALLQRGPPARGVAAQEARDPVVLLGHGHVLGEVGGHADVGGLATGGARHGRQRHPGVIGPRPGGGEHGVNSRARAVSGERAMMEP
jgi:hypothetical protein